MNRQIKFRVWDVEQNKFLSSYADKGIEFYHEQGKDWHEKQVRDIVPVSWFLQDHNNNLENYIVTQYTGLKGKDGKEIYEGDIVKWGDLNYIVEYNHTACKWQGRCPYYHSYHHPTTEHFRDLMNGIIISNIFEHKHLLEK